MLCIRTHPHSQNICKSDILLVIRIRVVGKVLSHDHLAFHFIWHQTVASEVFEIHNHCRSHLHEEFDLRGISHLFLSVFLPLSCNLIQTNVCLYCCKDEADCRVDILIVIRISCWKMILPIIEGKVVLTNVAKLSTGWQNAALFPLHL